MIVNHQTKVIIWQPFKNYSFSIDSFFRTEHGFEHIDGNQLSYSFNKTGYGRHTHYVPDNVKCYKKFLPIRNPYNRVMSQWKFSIKHGNTLNFDDWLLRAGNNPIMYPVTKLYDFDHLIHVEQICEELYNYRNILGIIRPIVEFPHINMSEVSNPILTQEQKDFIYYFHYSDFLTGSYYREFYQ